MNGMERDPAAEPADSPSGEAPSAESDGSGSTVADHGELEQRIVEALKTIFDPEIPVNIYELGLIYSIDIADDASVTVRMTLTAPACPAAGILPGEVEAKTRAVPGVRSATVDLVWDPPWSPDKMSMAAKLQLGML